MYIYIYIYTYVSIQVDTSGEDTKSGVPPSGTYYYIYLYANFHICKFISKYTNTCSVFTFYIVI
jgi:hypothetical protein